jgi:hypothetical protein
MSPEWDDKLSTKAIYIDHQEFEVRWNLYSALLHLRRVKPRELFWIDIICIDQSNVFERNSQLSHMRRIYQSAQETIIWFGPAVVSTKVAIERMTRFYANLSKTSQGQFEISVTCRAMQERRWWGRPHDMTFSMARSSALLSPPSSRAWIIQEITCSPNPTAMCGGWFAPWAS